MKISEIINEDISRRGFLRGAGAAAAGAATGALAAPFSHSNTVDKMTDKVGVKTSTVVSDDGSASLYVQWGKGVWFDLRQDRLDFHVSSGFLISGVRIKFGNGSVESTGGVVDEKQFKSMQLGIDPSTTSSFARRILSHSGELRIEADLYRTGKKVFVFHIEPDELTKQIKNTKQGPSQPKKISSQKVSDQFARHLSEQVRTYIPLVDFSKKFPRYHNGGPVKVQITISPRGDLLQRKLVKGSGDTDWDVVVLQALDKLSIMPNYPETLPSEFTVTLFDDGNEQVEEDATPESIAQINKLTRKR